MDRRDDNYYEAHAKTINLKEITSNEQNARILLHLRDNDPNFDFLQILSYNSQFEYDFTVVEEDDLGWLGYFVGKSDTLQHLSIGALTLFMSKRLGPFIQCLSQNRSIETLSISIDIGSASFRQMGDFFKNNNNLRELSFGYMDAIGIESARSIAFMLSQFQQSNLRILSLEESDASEEVLAEIVTAISSHPHLEELNLGANNLGRDGSFALGNALQACRNPQLKELILWSNSIDDEGLRGLVHGMMNCHNLSKLDLACNESITVDGFRLLSTLFQSEHCHLKHLDLSSMNMGYGGARAISTGLASLNLLDTLSLTENYIGDDGMSALASGLADLHSLEKMYLGGNPFGDLGVQALVEGLANCVNLKHLDLSSNGTITALGLRSLSTLLQSESCSLTEISVWDIPFGDEGAAALADALKGNKSMKQLNFNPDPESSGLTAIGWSAFSRLLCDTSSINTTYHSNHSLTTIGYSYSDEDTPDDVIRFLQLNKRIDKYVAIRKILKCHPDFDVEPFFESKLKVLPLLVSWFERVRTLADDNSWILDETPEEFQCRQLSTMYNFVRGMPLLTIDGYRSRNNAAVLAPSRKRKIEQIQLADES